MCAANQTTMSGVHTRWCYQWPGVTVVYVWCMVVCVLCMLVPECRMDPAAAAVAARETTDVKSVCTLSGCNCTTEHKYWTIVNCSLDSKQVSINKLEITQLSSDYAPLR